MPKRLAVRIVAIVAFVAFVACGLAFGGLAEAGPTGGSMGGGSWGTSSSSSSSSYGGGGGGGYSHSYSGGNSYSFGGGPSSYSSGGGFTGGDIALLVVVLLGAVVVSVVRKSMADNAAAVADLGDVSFDDDNRFAGARRPHANYADVTVLRIAVDGRARKFVQTELARVAKSADTSTPSGRAVMLREVALMLRRLKDAWVYGGAVNEQMREEMKQKSVFDTYVDDARARFTTETVRNEQGVTTTADAPAVNHEVRDDAGLILVTIVVAAHSELFEVHAVGDGSSLRQALESASHRTAEDLIAIEIIWMPADGADLVSSIDLEAAYPPPDLVRITGALVGKVFCAYCGGPFPAELVSCPHCGAPAAGAAPAVTPT